MTDAPQTAIWRRVMRALGIVRTPVGPDAPLPAPPGSGEVASADPHPAAVEAVQNVGPVRDNGKDAASA